MSIISEESLRYSKLPVTGYLRTKGQESVYETCTCVIHTILLSYIVSHFPLMRIHVLREALVNCSCACKLLLIHQIFSQNALFAIYMSQLFTCVMYF